MKFRVNSKTYDRWYWHSVQKKRETGDPYALWNLEYFTEVDDDLPDDVVIWRCGSLERQFTLVLEWIQ